MFVVQGVNVVWNLLVLFDGLRSPRVECLTGILMPSPGLSQTFFDRNVLQFWYCFMIVSN